ncbi:hypothetical protein SAICODRAFT_8532 [Saitoella complicata NRRL Y-17804]|uniref:Uncharacterized protein n=1 Tax=Saitoella complicata (strain BCRC 22490 / CBS 7301 / JCM 7358 / NBRC 10748 / NRRL Y-17804) TaxID=698492 RepID=A0A0E9NFL9_SAICN|nr:uncharacterized protein SAICODRAFT_8532 [Saitoella complicata NRRL Y-17804]ODQ51948.1 hypothetical protein SAICODRAFT_8532 [Saitoella complicata NRRL Y-17804]GAO48662.1 hypothetical protein G7K_2832-t1 [Saitoella complicata NRRL Y-17804]
MSPITPVNFCAEYVTTVRDIASPGHVEQNCGTQHCGILTVKANDSAQISEKRVRGKVTFASEVSKTVVYDPTQAPRPNERSEPASPEVQSSAEKAGDTRALLLSRLAASAPPPKPAKQKVTFAIVSFALNYDIIPDPCPPVKFRTSLEPLTEFTRHLQLAMDYANGQMSFLPLCIMDYAVAFVNWLAKEIENPTLHRYPQGKHPRGPVEILNAYESYKNKLNFTRAYFVKIWGPGSQFDVGLSRAADVLPTVAEMVKQRLRVERKLPPILKNDAGFQTRYVQPPKRSKFTLTESELDRKIELQGERLVKKLRAVDSVGCYTRVPKNKNPRDLGLKSALRRTGHAAPKRKHDSSTPSPPQAQQRPHLPPRPSTPMARPRGLKELREAGMPRLSVTMQAPSPPATVQEEADEEPAPPSPVPSSTGFGLGTKTLCLLGFGKAKRRASESSTESEKREMKKSLLSPMNKIRSLGW